jgi:hypothetical protein
LIRQANKYDIDKIIDLIKDFAIQSNNPMAKNPLKWSKNYVVQTITNILAGQGFILIDEKQTGILIAIKAPCLWCPDTYQLQEVLMHSKSKLLLARLIKEYMRIADCMFYDNEISEAIIGSYGNTNLEKFGMTKIQNLWRINNDR